MGRAEIAVWVASAASFFWLAVSVAGACSGTTASQGERGIDVVCSAWAESKGIRLELHELADAIRDGGPDAAK